MHDERTLQAIIFQLNQGRVQFDNVKLIRLKGENINYLLMLDHMPVIGELIGNMSIVCEEEEYEFPDIHGFFHLKNNEFHFLQQSHEEEIHT